MISVIPCPMRLLEHCITQIQVLCNVVLKKRKEKYLVCDFFVLYFVLIIILSYVFVD